MGIGHDQRAKPPNRCINLLQAVMHHGNTRTSLPTGCKQHV
jgi:hypothetical protein